MVHVPTVQVQVQVQVPVVPVERPDRDAALHTLLGINLPDWHQRTHVGDPFADDGPCPPFPSVDLDAAAALAAALPWMPNIGDSVAAARFLKGKGTGPVPPGQFGTVLCTELPLLFLGAAAEALVCTCETDLLDKTGGAVVAAKGPMPGDGAAVAAYVQRLSDDVYREDLAARIGAKRKAEQVARLTNAISRAVTASDPDNFDNDFVTVIDAAGIRTRSSDGYPALVKRLLAGCKEPGADGYEHVPMCARKLVVLLTGRDGKGNPIWAQGNVFKGDMAPFEAAFAVIDPAGNRWRRLLLLRKTYGMYKYGRDVVNRHGFGNAHPSWWALGYSSLADFQQKSPAECEAWLNKDTEVRGANSITARRARRR